MRTVTTILFALSLSAALTACAARTPELTDDARRQAEEFYRDTSVTERMERFRQYDVNDQYDIFIYGNQYRHPAAQYLAQCFALSGTDGVDLLRSKLRSTRRDLTVRDIVRLLAEIDRMRTYDVAGDAELMAEVAAHVSRMKDPGWRDSAQLLLTRIGHDRDAQPGVAPRCGVARPPRN